MNEENKAIPKEIAPKGIIRRSSISYKQKQRCKEKHNKLISEEREIKKRVSKVKIIIVKKDER